MILPRQPQPRDLLQKLEHPDRILLHLKPPSVLPPELERPVDLALDPPTVRVARPFPLLVVLELLERRPILISEMGTEGRRTRACGSVELDPELSAGCVE